MVSRTPSRRTPLTYLLRALVVVYLLMLVAWPVSLVAKNAFADGTADVAAILGDPEVVHALRLTVVVAVISVVLNTVFGVGVDFRAARRPGLPVPVFGRLKGDWLRCLPGKGRVHALPVLAGRLRRVTTLHHLTH